MKDRIARIIETKKITRSRFAEALGVSPAFVSQMCSGAANPSDRTVKDICRIFNVSELWLRTGEGEMFPPRNRLDELSYLAGRFLNSQPTEFQQRFALMMYALTEEEWALLEKKARFLLGQDGKAE